MLLIKAKWDKVSEANAGTGGYLSWCVKEVWVEEESVAGFELNKHMFEPLASLVEQL